MKQFKIAIFLGIALILNSCILKSIKPFYITSAIKYQAFLVGNWSDEQKNNWNIESLKQKFEEEKEDEKKLSKEELATYEKYKNGYLVTLTKNNEETIFIGMPFMVKNDIFVDFIPFDLTSHSNDLLTQHLLKTHSVAKVNILKNKQVKISWLDEDRIEELFAKRALKLKHERVGFEESLVLTASSNELYQFLEKYSSIALENKWATSEEFTLTKTNAKP